VTVEEDDRRRGLAEHGHCPSLARGAPMGVT
jgi:hypothetical protein